MDSLDDHRDLLTEIMIAIWYGGNLIALVDQEGQIYWRDLQIPLFLVLYLMAQRDHRQDRWC